VEGDESPGVEVGRAVVELTGGDARSAESRVRDLTAEIDSAEVEIEVNNAGYGLLQMGLARQAVQVFELNSRVFPDAWNVWDSLGEGQAELGLYGEAVRSYQRSLELNPDNANAVEMIDRIHALEEE
jgi:tetratricopeptide (TPR) repeat protein